MKAKLLLLLFIIGGAFAGCLETDPVTIPKRVELAFNAEKVGDTLNVEGSTISFEEVKFIVRSFNIYTDNEEVLQSPQEGQAMVFDYNEEMSQDRILMNREIGFEDFNTFSGYELSVKQARGEDNILDLDFYDDEQNYSMVIRGTYSRTPFVYKSSIEFEELYQFDQIVRLDENSETLQIRTLINLEDVFIDSEEGIFYNPLEEEYHEEIEARFKENLRVEASAISVSF